MIFANNVGDKYCLLPEGQGEVIKLSRINVDLWSPKTVKIKRLEISNIRYNHGRSCGSKEIELDFLLKRRTLMKA